MLGNDDIENVVDEDKKQFGFKDKALGDITLMRNDLEVCLLS